MESQEQREFQVSITGVPVGSIMMTWGRGRWTPWCGPALMNLLCEAQPRGLIVPLSGVGMLLASLPSSYGKGVPLSKDIWEVLLFCFVLSVSSWSFVQKTHTLPLLKCRFLILQMQTPSYLLQAKPGDNVCPRNTAHWPSSHLHPSLLCTAQPPAADSFWTARRGIQTPELPFPLKSPRVNTRIIIYSGSLQLLGFFYYYYYYPSLLFPVSLSSTPSEKAGSDNETL